MDTTEARRSLEEERKRLIALRDDRGVTDDMAEEQSESSGTLADYDQHPGDVGTETFERTKELALRDQIEARVADVDAALKRVEDGTYGRCQVCGREIEEERLAARPASRFCLQHREEADQEEATGPPRDQG